MTNSAKDCHGHGRGLPRSAAVSVASRGRRGGLPRTCPRQYKKNGKIMCIPASVSPLPHSSFDHCSSPLSTSWPLHFLAKICHVVSTQPLPMKVTSVTAHGDFFDRGDPVPKNATVIVKGVVDPLVQRLKLNKLVSTALAERAHRRNVQVGNLRNATVPGIYGITHGCGCCSSGSNSTTGTL